MIIIKFRKKGSVASPVNGSIGSDNVGTNVTSEGVTNVSDDSQNVDAYNTNLNRYFNTFDFKKFVKKIIQFFFNRYMLNRGNSKRHTMATPEDVHNTVVLSHSHSPSPNSMVLLLLV